MDVKRSIYTVGDSHCWHAWLKIPEALVNFRGPMTMHSFGIGKPIVVEGIPQDAIICFCWGEIDCRCHVHKYQPWQNTIDKLVENYLDVIRLNVLDRKDIWIFNVVPPPRRKGIVENPGFPFLGEDHERLAYVRYMNDLLRKSEFTFVDVYDKYCDAEGFLNMALSDGNVHIADEKPLVEWIRKRLN